MVFHETNRIEFKEKLTSDLEQETVAFLNSEGGDIFLGIRRDGTIAGFSNPDDIQLKIADRLRNNIRPSVLGLFAISAEKRNGKDIIIINVASGTEKPYCIKQKGYSEAGCFLRIGTASQPMPQEMIDRFLAKRHPLSLANIPSRRQELEFGQLKLFYSLVKKPLNDNFAQSLDLYNADGKYNVAALLFADNNNISVRVGKYSGADKGNLIEREDFKDCCLITAMKKVIDRLDIENRTQTYMRPMNSRIDKHLVDEEVLHEAIINAFVHNDYSRNLDTPIFHIFSNRFEILSFGGLVDGMTLKKFYSGTSMPRNRELMRIFKDLHYVEQLGNGIPKIVKKYGHDSIVVDGFVVQTILHFNAIEKDMKYPQDVKYPDMQYPQSSDAYYWVSDSASYKGSGFRTDIETNRKTIVKTSYKTGSKTTNKVIAELMQNPFITMDELANIIGISVAGIRWQMDKLKGLGVIRRAGARKNGSWEIVR